jgi:hypothetical protein
VLEFRFCDTVQNNNMEIQYNREVPLEEGGYGSVFPGTFQGREVAVKRVLLDKANDNEEKALKKLDHHPNIVNGEIKEKKTIEKRLDGDWRSR